MKKLLVIIAVVAVIAGVSVSGCRRSSPAKSSSDSFSTFNGGILDYDYWKSIKNPGVLGLDDAVTLAIGRYSTAPALALTAAGVSPTLLCWGTMIP